MTKNRVAPHLIAVFVLLLLLAGFLLRRASQPASPVATPAPATQTPTPTPPPPPEPEAKGEPRSVYDPALFLQGDLVVRVLATDGTPIAGAKVSPSLNKNEFTGEEGVVTEWRSGGGSHIRLEGKTPAFSGSRISDREGIIRLHVAIPRQERYLETFIQMRVEAPGCVNRRNEGKLRLPREGETKEITFRLQRGHVVRGKVLNLEGDDAEFLWIKLVPPEDEKKERPDWYSVPDAKPDGSFESDVAPPVPLLLIVDHNHDKYLPYRQVLHPPFTGVHEVVLQRNPDYKEDARVIFTITNPPGGKGFNHQIKIFSERMKKPHGDSSNSSELKQKRILRGGAYQVVLMSLDQDLPFWAHASFTVPATGTTEVPLTLQPCCTVRLRVREKATGAPPKDDNLSMRPAFMIGDTPVDLVGLRLGYGKTRTDVDGDFWIVTLPTGRLQLKIDGWSDSPYKETVMFVTTTPGEELKLDVLLEPAEK